MMTTETAVTLARYSDWADRVLFESMEGLPEGAAYRTSGTLFRSMIGTLNHNYQVDLIWRAHLQGLEHGFSTRRDMLHADLGKLIEAQCRINQWYIDWAGRQTQASLSEQVAFNFVSGRPGRMSRGGMLLHIVNHKTYHRGWVAEMFFDHGMSPPETDLCVFLTES
ncbi:MAG: DinB family protein [Burkholderiaceae bacterium]